MRACTVALMLACCTSPVMPPPPCTGCTDATGRCQTGDRADACGAAGESCTVCSDGNCIAHRCVTLPPAPCGPSNCSGCCDDGGVCRGGRSTLACGIDGVTCSPCAAGKLCSAGACITVTQCDVDCGGSCCPGASCAGSPCGFDGGACATCGAGELCNASGTCAATGGTRWKLRVVSAHVAPLKPSGEPWDDKSDPDPKVCASVGDAGQVCTLESTDTFNPAWNTLFSNVFPDSQLGSVALSVIDVDYPGETVLEEFGVLDLTPRWSGAQRWSLDGASVTRLRVDLEPAP